MMYVIIALFAFALIFGVGVWAAHFARKTPELNIGPIAAIAAFGAIYIIFEMWWK